MMEYMTDPDLLAGDPEVISLRGAPQEIAISDAGSIWTLVQTLHERWLVALDAGGRETARTDLRGWDVRDRIRYGGHPLRVAADGTAWVEAGHSLLRIASSGECLDRLDLGDVEDEVLSFLLLPDGFVVCLYAPNRQTPPRLLRLHRDGTVRWQADLPSAQIGRELHVTAHTEGLLASERSLLASFEEIGGGMCRSICPDLESGHLRWQTGIGPQESQAILGRERFLIGWQGYGAHHMIAFDPEGREVQRWGQHAWVAIGADGGMAGPEMENIEPSRSTFSRFLPDGRVVRGEHLAGYYTSYPALTASGWTVFRRDVEGLVAVDPTGAKHTLWTGTPERSYGTRIVVAPSGSILFGAGDGLYIVPTRLGALADGPWACAGMNGRNNPALL
jgi:hypothetical protein